MIRLLFLMSLFASHYTLFSQTNPLLFSYNYDLQITKCSVTPSEEQNSFLIQTTIFNAGLKNAETFTVYIFVETGKDSVFNETEDCLIFSNQYSSLSSKDSISAKIIYKHSSKTTKKIICSVDFNNDMKKENNIKTAFLSPILEKCSITINEIMFNPLTNSCEYIELFNKTNDTINIVDWKIADRMLLSGRRNELCIGEMNYILPGHYFTLAADSSVFNRFPYLRSSADAYYLFNRTDLNLNNDEDEIILIDLYGKIQDSLYYSEKWHNSSILSSKGISLEKRSPELSSVDLTHWTSSSDMLGGTPSKRNSAPVFETSANKKIKVEPNPFSPDGDGHEDYTTISYQSKNSSYMRLRIFDKYGRIQRTLLNLTNSANDGNIQWDGMDDNGRKLRSGIYIIFLELLDDSTGKSESIKFPVVIAGRR